MTLNSILDEFACDDDCLICLGGGHVCEAHPGKPWYPIVAVENGACDCGAAGMPCPGSFP